MNPFGFRFEINWPYPLSINASYTLKGCTANEDCEINEFDCLQSYHRNHSFNVAPCDAFIEKENEIIWTFETTEDEGTQTFYVFCNGLKVLDLGEELSKRSEDFFCKRRSISRHLNWRIGESDDATISYRHMPASK